MTGTVVGVFLEQAERRGAAPFLHRWDGGAWQALSWEESRTRVLRIGAYVATVTIVVVGMSKT